MVNLGKVSPLGRPTLPTGERKFRPPGRPPLPVAAKEAKRHSGGGVFRLPPPPEDPYPTATNQGPTPPVRGRCRAERDRGGRDPRSPYWMYPLEWVEICRSLLLVGTVRYHFSTVGSLFFFWSFACNLAPPPGFSLLSPARQTWTDFLLAPLPRVVAKSAALITPCRGFLASLPCSSFPNRTRFAGLRFGELR